jgi:hypothetical protein
MDRVNHTYWHRPVAGNFAAWQPMHGLRITSGVVRRSAPTDTRYQRYLKLRRQRRRVGLIWAIAAVLALIGAWDLACRVDETAYNSASIHSKPSI